MKKRSNLNIMLRLIGLGKAPDRLYDSGDSHGIDRPSLRQFYHDFRRIRGIVPWWESRCSRGLRRFFVCAVLFAVVRGFLRYAEQACNHFIAFKLLALIRDRVFGALRRLCPAKLEGRDKGNLINIITSFGYRTSGGLLRAHDLPNHDRDSVFDHHDSFIGQYHWAFGLLATAAYLVVGVVVPLTASKLSGDSGMRFRSDSGELGSLCAGQPAGDWMRSCSTGPGRIGWRR